MAKVGLAKVGLDPERWGFEGWGPERWGPPFRAFLPSHAAKFGLFFPLWGSFRGILVVFEAPPALNCARLEFSGCRVRRPRSRTGFHTQNAQKPKPEQLRVLVFKTPPKFNDKTTPKRKKRAKFWAVLGRAVLGKGTQHD